MIAPVIPAILSGFLAGSLHVISGPDHLTALGPVAVSGRDSGWRAGIRWGVGHSSGVALIGGLALLFREALPLEALSEWSERFVGVVLIGIGIFAIRSVRRRRIHSHVHSHAQDHGDEKHAHFHTHEPDGEHEPRGHHHDHAAFGIGVMHGLAGSSHFLGVLPALAFPNRGTALCYLLAFAMGSILTMGAFGSILDRAVSRVGERGESAYRIAMVTLGSLALLVGVWWTLR